MCTARLPRSLRCPPAAPPRAHTATAAPAPPRPSPTNTRTPRFTPLVIRLACFLLAGAWGLLSGGAYYALHRGSALEATPGANAALLGGAVALLTLFILSFLGGILLSVLDAGELGGAGGRGGEAGCAAGGRAGRSWRAAAAPPARPDPPLNPRTHPALPRSLCVLRAGQGRADREPPRGAAGGLQARACAGTRSAGSGASPTPAVPAAAPGVAPLASAHPHWQPALPPPAADLRGVRPGAGLGRGGGAARRRGGVRCGAGPGGRVPAAHCGPRVSGPAAGAAQARPSMERVPRLLMQHPPFANPNNKPPECVHGPTNIGLLMLQPQPLYPLPRP